MASTNKAVIVTGAASGIGLAMTMGLITEGHDVTAVDRNTAALAELQKKATGSKGSVQTVMADLAHPDSSAQVTGAALIRYGRIDALVNNAGIGQASVRNDRRPIRFWETTPEQWGRFIAVNAAGLPPNAQPCCSGRSNKPGGPLSTSGLQILSIVLSAFSIFSSSARSLSSNV